MAKPPALQSPRGTRDFYPEDMRLRTWLFGHFREVARRMGFEEVDAPVVEHAELFTRKAGEEIVEQLSAEGKRHLYVDGGITIQRFLKAGLIDEITITLLPTVLGTGIPLFGSVGVERRLKLIETASANNGFVQVRYSVEKA